MKDQDNTGKQQPSPADRDIDKKRSEDFFRLFMASQKRIYAYILMLMPNSANADEIMQEASAVMWQKFDEFTMGTSFSAWAINIARYEVLNFCKRQRKSRLLFAGDMIELFSGQAEKMFDRMEERLHALQYCVGNLSERDRKLIELYYEKGLTVKKMAAIVNRSAQGLYKAMNRIHNTLLKCVRIKLITEGS